VTGGSSITTETVCTAVGHRAIGLFEFLTKTLVGSYTYRIFPLLGVEIKCRKFKTTVARGWIVMGSRYPIKPSDRGRLRN